MEIKILGPICEECLALEKALHKAILLKGIDAEVSHITDFVEMAKYGIFKTPGLVVNDKVVISGRIPEYDEIMDVI